MEKGWDGSSKPTPTAMAEHPIPLPQKAERFSFCSRFAFMNKSAREHLIPRSRRSASHTFQQLKYFLDGNVIQKGVREMGGSGIAS